MGHPGTDLQRLFPTLAARGGAPGKTELCVSGICGRGSGQCLDFVATRYCAGLVDPEAENPPDDNENVNGAVGIEQLFLDSDDAFVFCLRMRSGVPRNSLPSALCCHLRERCSGEA